MLGLIDKHGATRLDAAGDPFYGAIKGMLTVGAETDPPPSSAGDGGAAAHLYGPCHQMAVATRMVHQ